MFGRFKKIAIEMIMRHGLPVLALSGGRVFWKPRLIGIEPTNRCNLRCVICARQYWDKDQNALGDMPIGLFRERILPFLDASQTVNLQCFGEPLLSPVFFEMLEACKKAGCSVTFTTNGLLLKDHAERIVELGTDVVDVSIDGIREFEKIRGIPLDAVTVGIKALNDAKKKLDRDLPRIEIAFVAMKRNIGELPDVVKLARELGARTLRVNQLVVHSKQLIEESLLSEPGPERKCFEEASRMAGDWGISVVMDTPLAKRAVCRQPFEMLFINWNGDVRPCCIATINEPDTLKIGNLRDSSLPELWNGPEMRRIRLSLIKDKGLLPFCRQCSMRGCKIRILKNG